VLLSSRPDGFGLLVSTRREAQLQEQGHYQVQLGNETGSHNPHCRKTLFRSPELTIRLFSPRPENLERNIHNAGPHLGGRASPRAEASTHDLT
jgi:hypothetical protein